MNKRKWPFELAVSALIFILFFIITLQFKSVDKSTEKRSRENVDKAEMQQSLYEAMDKIDKLKAENENLRTMNNTLIDDTAD